MKPKDPILLSESGIRVLLLLGTGGTPEAGPELRNAGLPAVRAGRLGHGQTPLRTAPQHRGSGLALRGNPKETHSQRRSGA